jgi:hypothetical protein
MSVDLQPLEQAVRARAPGRLAMLIGALQALEGGGLFAAGVQPLDGFARVVEAAGAILGDPEVRPGPADRWTLAAYGALLNSLCAAAGRWPEGLTVLDHPELPHADALLDGPLDVVAPRVLGLIATAPVLTAQGAARREALLERAERLEGLEILPTTAGITVASAAWMDCSYASGPRKHALKPVLNRAFRRLTAGLGLADRPLPTPRPRRERPVMAVVAEVMHEAHVQYRYFGRYLRQLRTRFRLVLVAPAKEITPAVAALFDETRPFDPRAGDVLARVATLVGDLSPDIVFWPSVGMAKWGPPLAGLRLAPIQLTALGHSASTFIPQIDYYLLEEGYVSDPARFSEAVLTLPDDSLVFERPPGHRPTPPRVREVAEPLRIAVPSNLLKLNPGFIAVLQRIADAAPRALAFHLFPNGPLHTVLALRAGPAGRLPGLVAYPRLSPAQYLEALNDCDLVLSPFPFGGLHSVVDALRQGLPVVAMDGAEPHGRTDAMLLRRLGLADGVVAADEDAYVAAALRLIGSDAERLARSRAALAADVDGVLFGDAASPLRHEVADLLWALYAEREARPA